MNTPNEWSDEDGIDFRALLAKLASRRWWIVGIVFAVTAAFTIAAFVMTPVYRAATVLVPAAANRVGGDIGSALGQLGGLAAIAGIGIGSGDSETEEALAVLRSRQFTERFIDDEGLMTRLFADKWDAANKTWKQGIAPTSSKAYRYFDEEIRSVTRDKKSGLITLQIEWRDRKEAAAWANEIVQRLNEEMRARAAKNAVASVGFLERELESTSNIANREAIGRLMEAQIKQRMLANVTQEYAFRVVDKAMPSDEDDPVKPQKLKMIAGGLLLGCVFGILVAIMLGTPRVEGESR